MVLKMRFKSYKAQSVDVHEHKGSQVVISCPNETVIPALFNSAVSV